MGYPTPCIEKYQLLELMTTIKLNIISRLEKAKVKEMSGTGLKEFSFTDLRIATRNFSSDNFLGQGCDGRVYKGWVDEETLSPSTNGTGIAVAIKVSDHTKMQGFREWQVLDHSFHFNMRICVLLLIRGSLSKCCLYNI